MIYRREELEKLADNINKTYFPKRLSNIIPLDSYALLEKIGCEIERDYVSPCLDIQGLIFFKDESWYIWDDLDISKKQVHKKKYYKGTIVINRLLTDDKKHSATERFVVNHENCHWLKDKDFFTKSINDFFTINKADSSNKTYWSTNMTELEIIERQTNYLNAAILMPKEVITNEFFKRLRFKNKPTEAINYEKYMKGVISGLAKDFGLNFNPVLYRLYDLKILKRQK